MGERGGWIVEALSASDRYQHAVSRVLVREATPYQTLEIVESPDYGLSLVLDGHWQSSAVDEHLYHETLVHPAMIAHGAPRRVLILGGAEGATLREVLRWRSVEEALMVDIDARVVDACREHLEVMHRGAFDDPRARVRIADAAEAIESVDPGWDVVLSDLSDPLEGGPAIRLFAREAFDRIRSRLSPDGVVAVQAGPVDPLELPVHARVLRTLAAVFGHAHSVSVGIPTMACTLGFGLGSSKDLSRWPDAGAIDRLLEENGCTGLRTIDGRSMARHAAMPREVREAFEGERRVYSLGELPELPYDVARRSTTS